MTSQPRPTILALRCMICAERFSAPVERGMLQARSAITAGGQFGAVCSDDCKALALVVRRAPVKRAA